jgi:hypothetical protein
VRLRHIIYKPTVRLRHFTYKHTARLEHIKGPISKTTAIRYFPGTVLVGYTNEEALPFVVKFDLGNLSCKYIYIYIYITAYRKSNRLFNILEINNIHKKKIVRQLIHHRNGRNR